MATKVNEAKEVLAKHTLTKTQLRERELRKAKAAKDEIDRQREAEKATSEALEKVQKLDLGEEDTVFTGKQARLNRMSDYALSMRYGAKNLKMVRDYLESQKDLARWGIKLPDIDDYLYQRKEKDRKRSKMEEI